MESYYIHRSSVSATFQPSAMKINKFSASLICIGSIFLLTACEREDLRIPECAKITFPLNKGHVPVGETVVLRWESSIGAAGYDVFVGEGAEEPVLIAENQKLTEVTLDVSAVENTSYSWYVLPR